MAHYALLNDDNMVVEVMTGRDEDEVVNGIDDWEAYYSKVRNIRVLRTSYNTQAGQHLTGGAPLRGNYAGIGFTYDETLDAFLPPKPAGDWFLDEATFSWVEVVDEVL